MPGSSTTTGGAVGQVGVVAAVVVSVLVAFGVGPSQAEAVRAVIVAAGPLVLAVWVHETHATSRHDTTVAAQVGLAKAAATTAAATTAAAAAMTATGPPGPGDGLLVPSGSHAVGPMAPSAPLAG